LRQQKRLRSDSSTGLPPHAKSQSLTPKSLPRQQYRLQLKRATTEEFVQKITRGKEQSKVRLVIDRGETPGGQA